VANRDAVPSLESPTRHFAVPEVAGPSGPRIGLVVPATDEVSEAALTEMLAGHAVSFVTSRVTFENPVTLANLARMVDDLTRATRLLLPGGRIDVVAFSCTSATVSVGVDAVARSIGAARPGVPFTTPITAAVAALARLEARRIAVLTPYVDEVNTAIRRFLTASGLEVAEFGSFHLRTEPEIASVPVPAIVAAGRALVTGGVDALFVSCTGLRGHAAIAALEAATGKPVVTSNQAQLWDALSQVGYRQSIHGYGRLLAALAGGGAREAHGAQLVAD
jgi:maleate isomerase